MAAACVLAFRSSLFACAPQSEEFKLQVADLFNEFDEDKSGALDKPELRVSARLRSPSFGASKRSGTTEICACYSCQNMQIMCLKLHGSIREHLWTLHA